MIKKSTPIFLVFSLLILSLFTACRKEKFTANLGDLRFSVDTLFFDTVFTERGTATRNFKIYNDGKATIKINGASMKGSDSPFRFNIDGLPGPTNSTVEIPGGDSIFVFIEAEIDPNGNNLPLIVEDELVLSSDQGSKNLSIVAWGQDAVYIRADTYIQGLPPFKVLEPNAVWTNEKPIVVYGYAVVDSLNSLRIDPGTQIHFHSDAGLWIYNGGQLTAEGTIEEPIVFQGDRLEAFYDELPGQWDRIWINESDRDHSMKNCIIKNSIIGLQIETLPFSYNVEAPTSTNKIELENIIIRNQSLAGILARNYRVDAGNIAIYNSGQHALAITGGGTYHISHLAAVNYWNSTVRKDASVIISNAYEDSRRVVQVREILDSYIENAIIYGSEENEFQTSFIDAPGLQREFQLRHSLLRSEEAPKDVELIQVIYSDPQLDGDAVEGYVPRSNSPAIDFGLPGRYTADITGKQRDNEPDLGVYEAD